MLEGDQRWLEGSQWQLEDNRQRFQGNRWRLGGPFGRSRRAVLNAENKNKKQLRVSFGTALI